MSFRRIVLPVDDTFATLVAVEWCLRHLDGSTEVVVHASALDDVTSFAIAAAGFTADTIIGPAVAAQTEALEAWIRHLRDGLPHVRGVLTFGGPVESLRNLTESEAADLLVLATDNSHRGADGRHASVVRGLVASPPCPLVVLPTTTTRRGARRRPAARHDSHSAKGRQRAE